MVDPRADETSGELKQSTAAGTRSTYVDQDTLDDAANAIGCGCPVSQVAAQIGIDESELRRLLKLPEWKRDSPAALPWDLPGGDT